jgi:acyl carrier protein
MLAVVVDSVEAADSGAAVVAAAETGEHFSIQISIEEFMQIFSTEILAAAAAAATVDAVVTEEAETGQYSLLFGAF